MRCEAAERYLISVLQYDLQKGLTTAKRKTGHEKPAAGREQLEMDYAFLEAKLKKPGKLFQFLENGCTTIFQKLICIALS